MHAVDLTPYQSQRPTNAAIAEALLATARMLEEREANPHRVQAYRTAADTVAVATEPLSEMVYAGGPEALESLPGVGQSLAQRIAAFVHTGELKILREMREENRPLDLLARVPGIGRVTAKKLHDELGIASLEALEIAAHDGRLAALPGFGPTKVRALRANLDAMLARTTRRDAARIRAMQTNTAYSDTPPVADLLSVDEEYRYRASRDDLRRIAPRRFNASGEAWLPVLEARRGPWRFTALFSNTPRAHEFGKTNDWVILYYEREGRERQCTVVTETRGDLKGRRVVRGREAECRAFYGSTFRQAA